MISSSNFVEIARLVVLARKDPGTKVPHKFQGKSLAFTEHLPSVFVTATVSNIVRFKINFKVLFLTFGCFSKKK